MLIEFKGYVDGPEEFPLALDPACVAIVTRTHGKPYTTVVLHNDNVYKVFDSYDAVMKRINDALAPKFMLHVDSKPPKCQNEMA